MMITWSSVEFFAEVVVLLNVVNLLADSGSGSAWIIIVATMWLATNISCPFFSAPSAS